MDLFGIGAAMKSMSRVYFQSARQSGRTVSMVESLKDGDRVVFIDSKEAERVQRMIKERGIEAECVVIPVREPERIFERGTSQGRTIFDHSWVQQLYENRLDACAIEIDVLEEQSSGYGEAHRETKRQAYEINKWRI